MDEGKVSELSKHGILTRFFLVVLGLCGATLMIATISILSNTDDDCSDASLREWLIVLAVILGVASLPTVITEIFLSEWLERKAFRSRYHIILTIETMIYFIWMAVGVYFIMDDDSCRNQFEDGYDLAFFLFGVSFIGAAAIVLGLTIGLLNKSDLLKEGYHPIS